MANLVPSDSDACDANQVNLVLWTQIFKEIHDDVQISLQNTFLAVGRGRRPALPVVTKCTNRLLLQFFNLKFTSNYSWETVSEWVTKLFPQYPSSRFLTKMKSAVSSVEKLSPEERQAFYVEEINLESIGPFCEGLNLTRASLLDNACLSQITPEQFTNGLLVELDSFCRKEGLNNPYLTLLLVKLTGVKPEAMPKPATLAARIKKVCKDYMSLLKSKKREVGEEKLNSFLAAPCQVHLCRSLTGHGDVAGNSSKVVALTGSVTASNVSASTSNSAGSSPSHQRCDSKLRKVQDELNIANRKVSELALHNSTLKEVISEKQSCISKLQLELETKTEKFGLEAKVRELSEKLKLANSGAKQAKQELKSFKSGAQFQRLKRRRQQLEAKEVNLKRLESSLDPSHVTKLRTKIRQLRSTLTSKNKQLDNHLASKTKLKKEVAELKEQLIVSESFLGENTCTEEIETRSKTSGNPFTQNIEVCVMHLVGELDVPSTKCSQVIQTVAKWIFHQTISLKQLPSSSTVIDTVDRAQVLSKYQVGEGLVEGDFDWHTDGTSRDHNKIIGQQVNTENRGILSAGFSGVTREDHTTLLDNAIMMLEELSDVYSSGSSSCDQTSSSNNSQQEMYKAMLKNMFATMSDRCIVQKAFSRELDKHRSEVLNLSEEEVGNSLHFLYCNAHFLLGLSSSCENVLKEFEKSVVAEVGHQLGRNNLAKFNHFSKGSESCVARYIRTACDCLGPRGDEKNGCRKEWHAFCKEKLGVQSEVTSFRMNRFNNFFQGAASLFHHQADIINFLSNYKASLNMKLESVLHDAQCCEVQALVLAVGILYYKVTGPFWLLLESDVQYVDLHIYVQEMLTCFENWLSDASSLLSDGPGIFKAFQLPQDEVYHSLFTAARTYMYERTKTALEAIMQGFVACTKRQLEDFLPGGKYGSEVGESLRTAMKHCKLTNLVSENEFGDLDFSQFRRRNASLHYHSGIQMVKKNHTISGWLNSKPAEEQSRLLKFARTKSTEMRKRHIAAEKHILKETREKLDEINRLKQEKQAQVVENKKEIVASVQAHGGPCTSGADVKRLLNTFKSKGGKMLFLKEEIRYLKIVLGVKNSKLIYGSKDVDALASDLIAVLALGITSPISQEISDQAIHPGPTSVSDQSPDVPVKDRTRNEVNDEDMQNLSNEEMCVDKFTFTNQGTWIAVAYEDDFFIGMVMDVQSEEIATVQFLQRGYKDVFRWPRVDDIAEVQKKFVFASDFEVVMSPNARTWLIPEISYLQDLYDQYQSMYF